MTPTEAHALLSVGMDVDWLKTQSGIDCYFAARSKGISVPRIFKARGFDHVRIRIKDYDLTTLEEKIVTIVDDCLAADLTPVVAFQAERFKLTPNEATQLEVVQWWNQVAIALQNHPERVLFNLIIETTDAVRNAPLILNQYYAACEQAIHAISPKRILIVPPCGISSPSRLPELKVPPNGFAEAHFYAAGFSTNPTDLKVWTTGTDKEKAPILKNIADIKAWQNMTGISVWVGAIMLGNFDDNGDAPSTSHYTVDEQIAIASFVCGELRKAGIPFAVNADQHYFDRTNNVWIEEWKPALDVILGTVSCPSLI